MACELSVRLSGMLLVAAIAATGAACADDESDVEVLSVEDAETDGIDWLEVDEASGPGESDAGMDGNGSGDTSGDPGEEVPDPIPGDDTCGALTIYTGADFGNVCIAPETPVNNSGAEDLTRADYNALENLRSRHMGQCQTMTAPLDNLGELQAWQPLARDLLRKTLRLDVEIWQDLPLDIREFEVEQFDGYTRRKIDYIVSPEQRIPAWLYIPEDNVEPRPAILFLHGHDEGGRNAAAGIEPFTESANYHRAAARRLAEAGYIVLAPDIRSFGETGTWAEHERFSEILHLEGRTPYGVFVADAMRAIDVLERLPYTDQDRIAVAGVSMGALITVFMGALDDRVAVTSAHGILGEFNRTLLTNNHDPCLYMPYFDRLFDVADVVLMGAPRPAYFVTGETDRFYPPDAARRAFALVQAGYELIGDASLTDLHVHDAGHLYIHEPSLAFLIEHLGDPGPPDGSQKERPNGSGASSPDETNAPSGTSNPPDPNEIYAARNTWAECAEPH